MNEPRDEERLDQLLAAAALGELSHDEERELDAALAADAGLQDELDAALDTAARIQAADPVRPPDAMKERVMRAIDDVAPAPLRSVVDLGAERSRRRARWLPIAAAAAFALVVAGGVIVTRNGDSTDVVAEVIAADDAEFRTFDGDLSGSLRAVFSADANALVIEGTDVTTVGDELTYQLWLVDGGGARSVGLFRPGPDGRVAVAFEGTDPAGFVLGVTVEPAGGSTAPTDPIVATA